MARMLGRVRPTWDHMRAVRSILGLAILTGCLPHNVEPIVPPQADADVFAAVFEHLRPRLADTILMLDSTIVYDVDRLGALAMGAHRFTPVAFNADSTSAYLYYEFFCGSLCGGGQGLWLTRSHADRGWRVRYVAPYWIS